MQTSILNILRYQTFHYIFKSSEANTAIEYIHWEWYYYLTKIVLTRCFMESPNNLFCLIYSNSLNIKIIGNTSQNQCIKELFLNLSSWFITTKQNKCWRVARSCVTWFLSLLHTTLYLNHMLTTFWEQKGFQRTTPTACHLF